MNIEEKYLKHSTDALNLNIKCDDGLILSDICPNEHGVYVIFKVPKVARGMHGKTKGHVDELLIVGLPWSKANEYLSQYNVHIMREGF